MALINEVGPPVASMYEENVENILDYCRICGDQKRLTELWNFKANPVFFNEYYKKLNFLNFYLDFNTNLPTTTCQPCYTQLNNAYYFFKRFEGAQVGLKIIYNECSPVQETTTTVYDNSSNYDADESGASNYSPGRKVRLQKIADNYNREINKLLDGKVLRNVMQPSQSTLQSITEMQRALYSRYLVSSDESECSGTVSSENYDTSEEIESEEVLDEEEDNNSMQNEIDDLEMNNNLATDSSVHQNDDLLFKDADIELDESAK